jgi:hypothetical protein
VSARVYFYLLECAIELPPFQQRLLHFFLLKSGADTHAYTNGYFHPLDLNLSGMTSNRRHSGHYHGLD